MTREPHNQNIPPERFLEDRLEYLTHAKRIYDRGKIDDDAYRDARKQFLITISGYQRDRVSLNPLYWEAYRKAMLK